MTIVTFLSDKVSPLDWKGILEIAFSQHCIVETRGKWSTPEVFNATALFPRNGRHAPAINQNSKQHDK